MIITPPPQAMTLINTVFTIPGAPASFIEINTISNAFTSFMVMGEQMYMDQSQFLLMRFVDELGGLSSFQAVSSNSAFAVGVETINVAGLQSQIVLSDVWDLAATAKGSLRIWFDNLNIASNAGVDFRPCFMGMCAVPKVSPSDCTLTGKFSGSITNIAVGRSLKAIRFYPPAGNIGGTYKLYGFK